MIHRLTELRPRFMLCPLSHPVKVGICTPRKGEKSPLTLVVFFRPQFLISTGLIRAKFIMVDCLRETLGLARSFAGSANLTQSTAMLFALTGGGLFTLQRNTAMSLNQTASSTQHKINPDQGNLDQDKNQASIVLNHRTVTALRYWLERAKQHTSDLVDIFATHENDLKLVEIEIEITTALIVLSKAVMQGEPLTPPVKASPEQQTTTAPQRQTTGHRLERDGAGYDCRVLLNEDGDDTLEINPCCTPPAGYRQVCIKCGFDGFDTGTIYLDCPKCRLQVVHYCRYVAIAGGV